MLQDSRETGSAWIVGEEPPVYGITERMGLIIDLFAVGSGYAGSTHLFGSSLWWVFEAQSEEAARKTSGSYTGGRLGG